MEELKKRQAEAIKSGDNITLNQINQIIYKMREQQRKEREKQRQEAQDKRTADKINQILTI